MGNELRHLAIVNDSAGLLEALRARAEELNVSRKTLNRRTKLADGYVSKILCGMRTLGAKSTGPVLESMGLVLIVAEDVEATAKLRAEITTRDRPPSRKYVPRHPCALEGRRT